MDERRERLYTTCDYQTASLDAVLCIGPDAGAATPGRRDAWLAGASGCGQALDSQSR